jgi:hypothetical protein
MALRRGRRHDDRRRPGARGRVRAFELEQEHAAVELGCGRSARAAIAAVLVAGSRSAIAERLRRAGRRARGRPGAPSWSSRRNNGGNFPSDFSSDFLCGLVGRARGGVGSSEPGRAARSVRREGLGRPAGFGWMWGSGSAVGPLPVRGRTSLALPSNRARRAVTRTRALDDAPGGRQPLCSPQTRRARWTRNDRRS